MPTQAYFDKYPTFPSDISVAKLPRLSFAKLLVHEENESNALFEACRAMGFFLLDFQGCVEGEEFLKKAETMFGLNEQVNAMDVDELMKYAYKPPHSLFGYKHIGDLKIEDGKPDRVAFYNVSQDDMTGVSKSLSNPPCIQAHRPEIKAYMEQAHSIASLVCFHLDAQLRLTPGTLASLQPITSPSGTSLRMLRYPPQPTGDQRTSLVGHTDLGSLTSKSIRGVCLSI
jgi:isopenicillin N synthase-like dioxygenase